MWMKGWGAATAALVVACGLTAPGAVAAPGKKKLEPLNQYVVTGGDLQELRGEGYDLAEGGSKRGQGIVATPAQAQDLRNRGFTVTAPYGEEKAAKVAPPDPFATNPTHGFNVF